MYNICIIYIYIYVIINQHRSSDLVESLDLHGTSWMRVAPSSIRRTVGKSWYNSQATVHMEPGTAPSWNVGCKIYVFINKMCICCVYIYKYICNYNFMYIYIYTVCIYIYICVYPPTPALAKAGAAPGTTAGVELLLLRFPRSNLSCSHQATSIASAVCQP